MIEAPGSPATRGVPSAGALYLKLAELQRERVLAAARDYTEAIEKAARAWRESLSPLTPLEVWRDAVSYWIDGAQRSVLFWDTLRQRGNNWIEHEKGGQAAAACLRLSADHRRADPCAPGQLLSRADRAAGGRRRRRGQAALPDHRSARRARPGHRRLQADSEVGFALKAGHPVYFVIFSPDPVDGQTLADVSLAEAQFLRTVRDRHPGRGRPVIVGNCQGGWAAMLVGALDPQAAGPIVVNGAPMSYWAGNDAENPMRYAGGILGGTWTALLASDLGGGKFDGAYLVDNFEYLNPANTYFTKHYNLYSKIDTEPERFLEFERWWGGYFLMNTEEIRWIVENLFVGNRLADGGAEWAPGQTFDLRSIHSPIILFASLGDNITPPQQAFNWVADVYPTTEDLKAAGQVIVGLMHESIGHLGIFVSASVARREHAQIVDLLDYIEHLPPGLYGMRISEERVDGKLRYDVTLTERRVEELQLLQKYGRRDELPFDEVARLSEINTRLYENFLHPVLAALITPEAGKAARMFHHLRMRRWAVSDLNPWLTELGKVAQFTAANRLRRDENGPSAASERLIAAGVTASLDLYRQMRDAFVENSFFSTYGPMALFAPRPDGHAPGTAQDRVTPAVRQALAQIDSGGFIAGAVRAALLAARITKQRKLSGLKRIRELVGSEIGLLDMPVDDARELIRVQSLIVEHDPDEALRTLPALLHTDAERRHIVELLDRLAHHLHLTPEQQAFIPKLTGMLLRTLPGKTPHAVPSKPKAVNA